MTQCHFLILSSENNGKNLLNFSVNQIIWETEVGYADASMVLQSIDNISHDSDSLLWA